MRPNPTSRRDFLRHTGLAVGAGLIGAGPARALATPATPAPAAAGDGLVRLSLNENPYAPSPLAVQAIQRELARAGRYADEHAAETLAHQVAACEGLPADQVILGEVLDALGLELAADGGPGGEFVYSTPGYLALVDATARLGGVGVAVPLDAQQRNDLAALAARVGARTRALYLVNPHNPSGTVNEDGAFKRFLREVSQRTLVIVDEAYLEYTDDFPARSAVDLVRAGANVAVFRTFAKIHGLAGLPFGYLLGPRALIARLRKAGAGRAEGIGRLTLAAAAAALQDRDLVRRSRAGAAAERARWFEVLRDLKLPHSPSVANFVFFDAGRPQAELAAAFRAHGVDIGRAFPPLDHWARISLGLPQENRRAQEALRRILG